jgi:hypothetical protein
VFARFFLLIVVTRDVILVFKKVRLQSNTNALSRYLAFGGGRIDGGSYLKNTILNFGMVISLIE